MNLVPKQKGWLPKLTQWIDGAIAAVSPVAGLRRQRNRTAARMLASYHGAEKSRLKGDWLPGGGSADWDLLDELPSLRERSRDLNRNNAFAASVTSTVVSQTVGQGIKAQSKPDFDALEITEQEAKDFGKSAERAWKRWMPQADAQGRMTFWEMQALVQRQILENGEVLVLPLMVEEPWRNFRLSLEIIEADRLETPQGRERDPNITDGVELGDRGQPIAYWIRKNHPGDSVTGKRAKIIERGKRQWVRIPARNRLGRPNVLHLYWKKRPGQTRGEPFFAPVMTMFKDLADYLEAELIAEKISACFAAFIIKDDPAAAAIGSRSEVNAASQNIQSLEPGQITYLAPGEDVKFSSPQRPGATFEPFVNLAVRSIGAALGLPFEMVMKDFSKTNYSSARAALLDARRFFKVYQQWIAMYFCQPVWEMVLEEAWLKDQIEADDLLDPEKKDLWMKASWIPSGWQWVDPTKEVQASEMAIKAGLSTLAEECASQGRDWEEVAQQLQREQQSYNDLEINKGSIAPGAAPASTSPTTEPETTPPADPEPSDNGNEPSEDQGEENPDSDDDEGAPKQQTNAPRTRSMI